MLEKIWRWGRVVNVVMFAPKSTEVHSLYCFIKNNSFKKHCHVDGNQVKGLKSVQIKALPEFTTKNNSTVDTRSKGFIPCSWMFCSFSAFNRALHQSSALCLNQPFPSHSPFGPVHWHIYNSFWGEILSQPSQNMKHSDTINLNHVVLNLVRTVSPLKGHPVFLLSSSRTENWVQVEKNKVLLVSTNNFS